MRKRIFIYIHYLEIGGAERALIGLLSHLDPTKTDIDLLLNIHGGEFMNMIPNYVNLLPQISEYSAIERPIKSIIAEGHLSIALRRILAKWRHAVYAKKLSEAESQQDESIYQYVYGSVMPALPDLSRLGTYDLAISFLHPHNIVRDKIKALRKICWVHTDYSTIHINKDMELPIWGAYDKISCIADDVAKAFRSTFPELSDKIIIIENILSPKAVKDQSRLSNVDNEMKKQCGVLTLLSIGRFSSAKRFDSIPQICRHLLDRGLKFRWYIIGYGDDTCIQANIQKYDVSDILIILGKRSNPYPYIAACDIYVQPSLYEGKCMTVREAQILCRPTVITAYPTASSQIVHGIDGIIVPIDIKSCAEGLYEFANDITLRNSIVRHLSSHDYGNAEEAQKIYELIP